MLIITIFIWNSKILSDSIKLTSQLIKFASIWQSPKRVFIPCYGNVITKVRFKQSS